MAGAGPVDGRYPETVGATLRIQARRRYVSVEDLTPDQRARLGECGLAIFWETEWPQMGWFDRICWLCFGRYLGSEDGGSFYTPVRWLG